MTDKELEKEMLTKMRDYKIAYLVGYLGEVTKQLLASGLTYKDISPSDTINEFKKDLEFLAGIPLDKVDKMYEAQRRSS